MNYNPRRPFDDEDPHSYEESDRDYVMNNIDLAVKLLDQQANEPQVSDWLKLEMAGDGAVTPVERALYVIGRFGGIDGGHHKQWVLDQAARLLLGADYPEWVAKQKDGVDGPNTYDWDEGIAP